MNDASEPAAADCRIHLPPPSPSDVAGAVIGPYKLVQRLGEGGMGTVWLAEQTEPVKRTVALKLIKPGMDSRQVLARFEAERQALALMDHPNIARVFDAGTTERGRPYFVMELVQGVPITRYCDEQRLTPRERLELFIPVCQAIQHAHQKGIIHRDIKPSNVLVTCYDGKPVPKVIDFGIAKATGQLLTEHTLVTGFGTVVGTLEYMSPEQAAFNQLDIDTRSDIYSLGVLLYELLTGTTPLDRRRLKEAALLEVLRQIREEEPPRPSTRLSTTDELPAVAARRGVEASKLSRLLRGELDWIVMKTLDKDRNRRYESASSLALDLHRYLSDEPVQACPPSAWYRLRKLIRRNKVWVGTAALVSAVLVLATGVSAALALRAREAEASAQKERAKAENLAQTETLAHTRAREQTRLAEERAEDLARRLYIYRVNLAHREAVANNVAQADALLDACEPSRRGWEWTYSKRLCHLETLTLGGFADHAAAVAGARCWPANLAIDSVSHSLVGPEGTVQCVVFSPDGLRFATAHNDGAIVLWDARTGREVRALVGHVGSALCLTFDGDGGRLISGGHDRTMRVWDVNTGEQMSLLRGHTQPVLKVALRPGTNQIASCAYGAHETFRTRGFEIKQWDLAAGREIRTLYHRHGWSFTFVAFSPDGQRLLSASTWGGYLRFWDPETGQEVEARMVGENVRGLAVSAADGRIAFGGAGNSVGLMMPKPAQGFRTLQGHAGFVRSTAFSPDGSQIASAGEDGTIKVWNAAAGREVMHLRGHTGSVTGVAFSRDGGSLVSSSEDGTVKLWKLAAGPGPFPMNLVVWVTQVHFSPDGRRLAIGRYASATIWDAASQRALFSIAPPGGVDHLTYSRDGALLATCAFTSEQVRVWDAETGRPVATCAGHTGPMRGVAFGPGGLLASAGEDGTVRLWNAATGQAELVIRAHEDGACGVMFDPMGAKLATVGRNGAVRLWEATTGRLVREFGTPSGRLSPHTTDILTFSSDGRRLAAVCGDATVRVWEVATGNELLALRGHTRPVQIVVVSPDGRRFATGSEDHTIKLWDTATGDEVFTLRGHTGAVLGLGFSPDGNRIVSAGADGMVWSWDATPPPWSR